MTDIIMRLNKQQEEKADRILAGRSDDPYAVYEERKAKNHSFEIKFTMSNKAGDLYMLDENRIRVVLPVENLQKTDRFYNEWLRGNYVGIKLLEVAVDRIDRENGTVYLKSGRVTGSIIKSVRAELDAEVRRRGELLHLGQVPEPYMVYGVVQKVNEDRTEALVRLFGQNIYGLVRVEHWGKYFTRTIPAEAENDNIPRPFDLTGTVKYDGRIIYRLSAKRFGDDSWSNIPDYMLEEKSVWVVRCLEKPRDKNHWWGKTDGIDIELVGNYSTKFEVEVGKSYLCTLKRSNSKNHTLIVTPFRELDRKGRTTVITKQEFDRMLEEKAARESAPAESEG